MEHWINEYGLVIFHTFVIYLFLIATMRIFARRLLGQLTVIDLVVIILLGSAVETSMVDGNTSLIAGLVCATTLFGLNRLISVLASKSPKWQSLVSGSPLVLVKDGHVMRESLRRSGLDEDQLKEAIRERGVKNIKDVAYAVLELDGEVTVVSSDATIHRTSQAMNLT